jgi:broad specificity phosphatase PhoE
MKVYFVRHGESVGNKAGIHQTSDMGLSDYGKSQAHLLAKRLKNVKLDLIYSSTYLRARQTSEILNEVLGVPVEYWDSLTELRNPSEIHNKKVNDPKIANIKELVKKNFGKENFRYSDEETFPELNTRVESVLSHLIENHQNEHIVCVSHASMIKAILCKMVFGDRLTGQVFTDFRYHFWSTNTGISVCEYGKDKIWGITSWNDISHL